MKFYQLSCNGKRDPLGTGRNVVLQWNFATEEKRNETQRAFRVTVWNEHGKTVADSGKCQSNETRYTVDPTVLDEATIYRWQVQAWTETDTILSDIQTFETAISDLSSAAWIECGVEIEKEPSAPIFQKAITVAKKLLRARIYITGLGLIRCMIDGKDCTKALLLPPNTPYEKQVYFETMDLTPLLSEGDHTVSVQLGNGYNADYSQWGYRYNTPKGFRAVIILIYTDGTTERINTDEDFRWQESTITKNGLYFGEECDARRHATETHAAVCAPQNAPQGKLIPDEMPPIIIKEELAPIAMWETESGKIYDFGKNMQGICRICVTAPEGCAISLRHAEMVTPEGALDTFTNRRARATDVYICKGDSKGESYQPSFTYHGFRYVLVESDMPLTAFRITALFLSADVGSCARFESSEPIINRIHTLSTNSIRSNLSSIPTDCPVRDERTPCWMDSQMYEDASMYNFDMRAYYTKWFRDCMTRVEDHIKGNMDWNGDPLMLAYRMYLFYGDLSLARESYDIFKKTLEEWLNVSDNGIWTEGYGDWCLPNENKWESYFGCPAATNTSLLHAYAGIMTEFARIFSKADDEARFHTIAKTIREAFIARLWHEDGTVGSGRQPEMLMPLFYGVLTGEKAEKTKQALLKKIRADRCFDTGGFSLRTVIPVLADADALDLFLETIRFNHYPGFGYWNALGATTLWEQWASKGGMHSHNHAMHGGICAALFQTLCGVVPTSPAFHTFRIAPRLPKEMRFVCCELNTQAGAIAVSVEKFGDSLVLSCSIPPNTEAELTFPDYQDYASCLLFDGERQIEKAETMRLGSGNYLLRLVPEEIIRFRPYQK